MQFSNLFLSAAALVPSALACMDVNITYIQGAKPMIYASFLDNGRITCYYNEPVQSTSTAGTYALNTNNLDVANETQQGCVANYWTSFTLDTHDESDHQKNNELLYYRYVDSNTGALSDYRGIALGDRITTAANGNTPETWTWLAYPFC